MSAADNTRDEADEIGEVAEKWWLFLVSGIMWILFAFVVLSWDLTTVWAIAVFAGVGFISGGVVEIAAASMATSWKWLHVMFGVISIVAGIVALLWPGQTFLVLAAIIGWYVLFSGVLDMVAAFVAKETSELWWLNLVVGIVQVLIGFWAVGYAGRSATLLVVWVAATALARGMSSLFLAFGLHSAGKGIERLQSAH
jgi:uncharacterized membrane protein HdeD (DUF308 family)